MANVTTSRIDDLNAVITVELAKAEYLPKVQKEINRYAQRAQTKGFRPGKTPTTLVKKMYGDSFMLETVNEVVSEKLQAYIQENGLKIFGYPIASESQDRLLDPRNPQDISINFDIAFMPSFEIAGLDTAFEFLDVTIDPAQIDTEIETARKKKGVENEITADIQEGDMLTLKIKEVGGSLEKEELMLSTNWLNEDMKSVFLTQKKGDHLQVNIFQLERETSQEYVRKYFLGLEEGDNREVNELFDATIIKVTRIEPAELNEVFFQENFGVATHEEARKVVEDMYKKSYTQHAESLLLRDIQERILAETTIPLPDSFLKRWLKAENKDLTTEQVEEGYEAFTFNLKWSLIRSKVFADANISITQGDMRDYYAERIKGYLQGMPVDDNFVNSLMENIMKDEKKANELYEDVAMERFFQALKEKVSLDMKATSVAEFNVIIQEAQARAKREREEQGILAESAVEA